MQATSLISQHHVIETHDIETNEANSDFYQNVLDDLEINNIPQSFKPQTILFGPHRSQKVDRPSLILDSKTENLDLSDSYKIYEEVLNQTLLGCRNIKKIVDLWTRNLTVKNSIVLRESINEATTELVNQHEEAAGKLIKSLNDNKIFSDHFDNYIHGVKNRVIAINTVLSMLEGSSIDEIKEHLDFINRFLNKSWTFELLERNGKQIREIVNGTFIDYQDNVDKIFKSLFNEAIKNHSTELRLKISYNISYKDKVDENLSELPKEIWLAVDQFLRNAVDSIAEKQDENGTIKFKIKSKKNKWIISMNDNGIGMSKETIERIIVDGESTKNKVHGGKGLTNALNVVCDALEGICLITSQEGFGTQIKVKIPKKCK